MLIETYRERSKAEHEAGISKQSERLTAVTAKLAVKEMKTALNEHRIATNKLSWHQHKLRDLVRVERRDTDDRVYPQWYTPVIVEEAGNRVIRPMRYLCRPENMPAVVVMNGKKLPFEVAYSGCYNARRDNLEKFWRCQFGSRHAYIVIRAFYEHVERHKYERRDLADGEQSEDMVIGFRPNTGELMKVACLWSHIDEPGQLAFDSVAAITDEPPPEVAVAGHDRCLIPLNDNSLKVWLNPSRDALSQQYEALDNRVRPYYDHRLAA